MKAPLLDVFYSKRSFLKRFSLLFLGMVFLAWTGNGCGGAAAPGGISLPAPTADLQGGSAAALKVLCGAINGAPQGAIIQIINVSDSKIPTVRSPLDANNSFSLQTCILVDQTVTLQVFDQNLNPISEIQSITRNGTEPMGICPAPTNTAPTCP